MRAECLGVNAFPQAGKRISKSSFAKRNASPYSSPTSPLSSETLRVAPNAFFELIKSAFSLLQNFLYKLCLSQNIL